MRFLLLVTSFLLLLLQPLSVLACNDGVCASIVSKCMLLQSCKCELEPDCTCCKQCFECLNYLYSECCSCVDMCPKPNVTIHELSRMSHRETLEKSIPTLFQALTAQSDPQARWSIVTFPIDVDTSSYQPTGDKRTDMVVDSSSIQSTLPDPGLITLNCTVAYMGQCMSWNKCKASCTSMGASSYRWFHDGCCECVGSACQARPENQFGIDQSRCEECPLLEDQEVTDEEMERLVNMDNMDYTGEYTQHYPDTRTDE